MLGEKTLKKTLFLFILAVMILVLVGCNKDLTSKNTDSKENNKELSDVKKMSLGDRDLAQKCAGIVIKQNDVSGVKTYVVGNSVFVTIRVAENSTSDDVVRNVEKALKSSIKSTDFHVISDSTAF